jgi:hypothetical protein
MNDIYAGDKAMRLNLGIRRRLAPWFDRRQSSENSNRAERRLEPKVFRRRSSETVCAIDRRPSLWLCGSPRVVANQPFCPQRDGTHHRRPQNDSCARKRIDWVSIQPITGILAYVRQLGDETILVVNHLFECGTGCRTGFTPCKYSDREVRQEHLSAGGEVPNLLTLGPYHYLLFSVAKNLK